jgi:hypothetical protein
MTLRSEIYFCILKSSSIVGKGVSGSAKGLAMSVLALKDSKKRGGKSVKKSCARIHDDSRLKQEGDSDCPFCVSPSIMTMEKWRRWTVRTFHGLKRDHQRLALAWLLRKVQSDLGPLTDAQARTDIARSQGFRQHCLV